MDELFTELEIPEEQLLTVLKRNWRQEKPNYNSMTQLHNYASEMENKNVQGLLVPIIPNGSCLRSRACKHIETFNISDIKQLLSIKCPLCGAEGNILSIYQDSELKEAIGEVNDGYLEVIPKIGEKTQFSLRALTGDISDPKSPSKGTKFFAASFAFNYECLWFNTEYKLLVMFKNLRAQTLEAMNREYDLENKGAIMLGYGIRGSKSNDTFKELLPNLAVLLGQSYALYDIYAQKMPRYRWKREISGAEERYKGVVEESLLRNLCTAWIEIVDKNHLAQWAHQMNEISGLLIDKKRPQNSQLIFIYVVENYIDGNEDPRELEKYFREAWLSNSHQNFSRAHEWKRTDGDGYLSYQLDKTLKHVIICLRTELIEQIRRVRDRILEAFETINVAKVNFEKGCLKNLSEDLWLTRHKGLASFKLNSEIRPSMGYQIEMSYQKDFLSTCGVHNVGEIEVTTGNNGQEINLFIPHNTLKQIEEFNQKIIFCLDYPDTFNEIFLEESNKNPMTSWLTMKTPNIFKNSNELTIEQKLAFKMANVLLYFAKNSPDFDCPRERELIKENMKPIFRFRSWKDHEPVDDATWLMNQIQSYEGEHIVKTKDLLNNSYPVRYVYIPRKNLIFGACKLSFVGLAIKAIIHTEHIFVITSNLNSNNICEKMKSALLEIKREDEEFSQPKAIDNPSNNWFGITCTSVSLPNN